MPKKRKAAATTEADEEPTSSVKVSKRAKTMAAEGAAKASAKSSAKVPKGDQKDAYDRVQDALAQLEEHEALLTSFAEEDKRTGTGARCGSVCQHPRRSTRARR
jgi:hypothetical protein